MSLLPSSGCIWNLVHQTNCINSTRHPTLLSMYLCVWNLIHCTVHSSTLYLDPLMLLVLKTPCCHRNACFDSWSDLRFCTRDALVSPNLSLDFDRCCCSLLKLFCYPGLLESRIMLDCDDCFPWILGLHELCGMAACNCTLRLTKFCVSFSAFF